MKSMKPIVHTLNLLIVCACSLAVAASFAEGQRQELVHKIQEGDPASIFEAGRSGDSSLIPALQGLLQARSNAVAQEMNRWEQAIQRKFPQWTEEEQRNFMPRREEFMRPEHDDAAENARTALIRLGIKKYLDEILTELRDPRSSMVVRVRYPTLSPHDIYRVQVKALGKLGYLEDPAVVKLIGPYLYQTNDPFPRPPEATDAVVPRPRPLAQHAVGALRKIVKDGPDSDDVKAWQQWWEQKKEKYP